MINPLILADARRKGVYQNGKILLSNFEGSVQQTDLDKTKGAVKGAVDSFYRVKSNVKSEPWKEYLEKRDPKLLMFDFNWWPIPELGGEPEDYNEEFIYQLKGCNVTCNFCFVDRYNNNGRIDHGAQYFSPEFIVDTFLRKREEMALESGVSLNALRASGGEPSLVPEQWLLALQELERQGMSGEVYFQSDTNLTTGRAIDHWMETGELNPGILGDIAEYKNFGLLSCFKGTDPESFVENTGCLPQFFDEQFYSFRKFLDAGIPIYPHLINPNPETLESFMEKLAEEFGEEMWGMVHLFSIGMYGPVGPRLEKRGRDPKKVADEWADNYSLGEEMLDDILQKRFGVGYKETPRPETLREMLSR